MLGDCVELSSVTYPYPCIILIEMSNLEFQIGIPTCNLNLELDIASLKGLSFV